MDRIILHCDCNNFFASVEEKLNPELKSIPIVVGGDEENRHGIVLAKNELAKKYGIKTAETLWQARKKCPDLKTVPPHHSEYSKVSKQINKIYEEYTDLVIDCLERLPQHIVVHRITGDGPKNILLAPLWSGNKKASMNQINKELKLRDTWQGRLYHDNII